MKKTDNELAVQQSQTAEKIKQTALTLFAQRGYANVSVEDLCEIADITKPTFYNHIPSKKALFMSFYALDSEDLDFLNQADSQTDCIRGIQRIYRFLFAVCSGYGKDMFSTLLRISMTCSPEEMSLRHEVRDPLFHLIQLGQKQGTISTRLSDEQLLSVLNSYFYGYCFYFCTKHQGEDDGFDEMERQIEFLLKGRGDSHES